MGWSPHCDAAVSVRDWRIAPSRRHFARPTAEVSGCLWDTPPSGNLRETSFVHYEHIAVFM